jgi:hypothetical protein
MERESVDCHPTRLIPGYMFSPARLDRDLVANFFMLFARAEFALKKAGFARARRNGQIDVDWDGFARTLGDAVTQPNDGRVYEAVKYLQDQPPQKQVLRRDGNLSWEPRPCKNPTDPVFVIRSITTARNNLFHGGKEIVGLLAERDRQLLQHCLLVLEYCLTLNNEVLSAFSDLGPERAIA